MITASRYHDISCGHRVVGHENKCRHLHGHNYRVHFHVRGDLDKVGRVLDFGVIKSTLCEWLENEWDHKMLIWYNDPYLQHLLSVDKESIVTVPFNPTAENMAEYLILVVAPKLLAGKDVELYRVVIEETRKCSAEYKL